MSYIVVGSTSVASNTFSGERGVPVFGKTSGSPRSFLAARMAYLNANGALIERQTAGSPVPVGRGIYCQYLVILCEKGLGFRVGIWWFL